MKNLNFRSGRRYLHSYDFRIEVRFLYETVLKKQSLFFVPIFKINEANKISNMSFKRDVFNKRCAQKSQ